MQAISKAALCVMAALGSASTANAAGVADSVYFNGSVYTVDSHDSIHSAIAVAGGRIIFVGDDASAKAVAGPKTQVVDLHGRMLMPGLVDGHMHPLDGGAVLLKCNLNYERLTVPQFQARIQACLDKTQAQEPDQWLEVVNWFQQDMLPAGTTVAHETLDALKTQRPISVMSSFGHSVLANRRALALAHVTAGTADPLGGKIQHASNGEPNGILEDAAFAMVTDLLPAATPAEDVKAAAAALEAMRRQGITSFLDAAASEQTIAAFSSVQHSGGLTARGHFAVQIKPAADLKAPEAVAKVRALAGRFDQGKPAPTPGIAVRNAKLFLDGVIAAPAFTGAMLEPYLTNKGTAQQPHWVAGPDRGPPVYFPAPLLRAMLLELARAGIEPHMHADGDRAVREGLDAVQALRAQYPESAIRAAIAHDEIVDPADFPRYAQVGAIPVLSFQWEKPGADTIDGSQDFLGPVRFKYIEPAAFLQAAGARIAFGSDWPVDALNEWFAIKVGVTRENSPAAGTKYAGRLGADSGLSLPVALRAITANSAYELHAEADVGSLEVGKFADFIVLDRNLFKIQPREIADTQVMLTVVGGKSVYRSDSAL